MKSVRVQALLSREDVRVLFKKSGSSDAEGNHLYLEKYLETLEWSHRATFVKEKVNKRLSWNRRI